MKKKKRGHYVQHDPTPEEIAERTAEIREGWTEFEYQKRAMAKSSRVEITRVSAWRGDRFTSVEAKKD